MSFVKISNQKMNVSKILCVGANYREHIIEMNPGKTPEFPTEPVIFLKPPSAIIHEGEKITNPKSSHEMHHEVELVILIGKDGKNIALETAEEFILGYGIGLDMTLRDLQSEAKKKGRPWAMAKGFDTSAVLSEFLPKEKLGNPMNLNLSLSVNGQVRQTGNTSDMIFSPAEVIIYVSQYFTLLRGDIIFTGTPKGVGAVHSGDQLEASLENGLVGLNVAVL